MDVSGEAMLLRLRDGEDVEDPKVGENSSTPLSTDETAVSQSEAI